MGPCPRKAWSQVSGALCSNLALEDGDGSLRKGLLSWTLKGDRISKVKREDCSGTGSSGTGVQGHAEAGEF